MAVGHEYSGEIVELGSEVRGFNTGDRVSGEGHITCGHCRNCRAGSAPPVPQYLGVGVTAPARSPSIWPFRPPMFSKLPDAIDDEIAAILDPFGNATHRRWHSTWSAKTYSSRVPAPSASWRWRSPGIAVPGTSSSPT